MKKLVSYLGLSALLFSCADYDSLDGGAPPESELVVAGVRDTTVTLRWTMCADENFKNYKVYYDSGDAVDFSDKLVDSLSFAKDTVLTVRTLRPATRYCFRVFVTNQAGKPSASNTASAVTWISLSSQQAGDSAVLFKWTRLKNVPVDGYYLFRDTTDDVDTSDEREGPFAAADSAHTVKRCPAGNVWRFRVFAKGDGGYGTASAITRVNGWWFKLYRPLRISDTAVALRWARPAGNAGWFRVFRDVKPGVDTADTACPREVTDTFMTIGNLDPKRNYWFKVYARNDASGYTAWTSEDSARPLAGAPALEAARVRDTTITFRWNRWQGPLDEFRCYRIYGDTGGSIDQSGAPVDSISSIKDTTATVTGLTPATRYQFRLYVTDAEGRTSADKPVSACTGLRFSDGVWMGDSAKRFGWTRIKNHPADGYLVFGDTSDTIDSSDAKISSDGALIVNYLGAGTVMRYRVYATAGGGGYLASSGVMALAGWTFKLYSPDTASDSTARLHWARVGNAATYRVYRGHSPSVDSTDTLCTPPEVTDTTVLVKHLAPKATHWFKVYALDDHGDRMAWTKPDSIRLKRRDTAGAR